MNRKLVIATAGAVAALTAAGCGSTTIVQPPPATTTAPAHSQTAAAPAQNPGTQQTTPATAPSTAPATAQQPPAQSPSANPADTVQAYFAAINSHNYAQAWALGGKNTGSSYASFVSGFGTTVNDTVTILSVSGNVVTAQLAATQTDGSVAIFQGTYTVSNGIIVGFDVHRVS